LLYLTIALNIGYDGRNLIKTRKATNMKNPIEVAVAHLRDSAIERANIEAHEIIAKVLAQFEAHDWNLDIVAPRPNAKIHGRTEYRTILAKHDFYNSLATYTQPSLRHGEPNIRKACPKMEDRFITAAKENAASQYDAFVAKLISKIGQPAQAALQGNHVWDKSFLLIEMADGDKQIWKTQMIINVSKLGKLFNQFPTRQVKRVG